MTIVRRTRHMYNVHTIVYAYIHTHIHTQLIEGKSTAARLEKRDGRAGAFVISLLYL